MEVLFIGLWFYQVEGMFKRVELLSVQAFHQNLMEFDSLQKVLEYYMINEPINLHFKFI